MFLAEIPSQEKWRVGYAPDHSLLNDLPDDAAVMVLPLHRLWKLAIERIGAEA